MEFDKEQIHQLRAMLEEQRSDIALDTRAVVSDSEARLTKRIDRITDMESGDIEVAYKDIVVLKKKVKNHETRLMVLER